MRPVDCDEGCEPAPPHQHWVAESCYVKLNSRDPLLHTRDDQRSVGSSFDTEADPRRALRNNRCARVRTPGSRW